MLEVRPNEGSAVGFLRIATFQTLQTKITVNDPNTVYDAELC